MVFFNTLCVYDWRCSFIYFSNYISVISNGTYGKMRTLCFHQTEKDESSRGARVGAFLALHIHNIRVFSRTFTFRFYFALLFNFLPQVGTTQAILLTSSFLSFFLFSVFRRTEEDIKRNFLSVARAHNFIQSNFNQHHAASSNFTQPGAEQS